MTTARAVFIAGPTASGKSALAFEARGTHRRHHCQRRFHAGLSRSARHHRTAARGRRGPGARIGSTGLWMQPRIIPSGAGVVTLKEALKSAAGEGRVPILVGGTGLYFKALTTGLAAVPPIPADIRAEVRSRLQSEGAPALHAELSKLDAATAQRVTTNDRSRISRALEVVLATGRSLSDWHREGLPPILDSRARPKSFMICDRKELVRRIEARFDAMLKDGGAGRSSAVGGPQARSFPARHEGAWRPLVDPASQWRHFARGSQSRRGYGHPPLCEASAHLVSQSDEGLGLGQARMTPFRASRSHFQARI